MATATNAHPPQADEEVHRLSTEEYERIVETGALEDLRVDVLDAGVEGVDPTTVAALLDL